MGRNLIAVLAIVMFMSFAAMGLLYLSLPYDFQPEHSVTRTDANRIVEAIDRNTLALNTAMIMSQEIEPPVPKCDMEREDFAVPAFYCPAGLVPDGQCKQWCDEAYQELQYWNLQTYCKSMEFADAQHEQAIQFCMNQYDSCLRQGGDPRDCEAEVNSCLADADAKWANLHKQITDIYNSTAIENIKAYAICMESCCD